MKKIAELFKGLAGAGVSIFVNFLQTSLKSKRIFNAYEAGEYGEMQKMLQTLTASQYLQQVRLENLTLLHHVAFSGNIEALSAMGELPYFKEILDESDNEVRIVKLNVVARMDTITLGSYSEAHDCSQNSCRKWCYFAETKG